MSGKKGTSTFVMQRASAVILLPFAIWFLWIIAAKSGQSFDAMAAWMASPFTKILLGAFVTVGALHGRIGVMEVIEDYIHGGLNGVLNMANWAAALGVIALTWWSLLSI